MSKFVYFIILGGLVLAALAAINISSVNADEDIKFIPISVLSKQQANYGADDNLSTIPAVSVDILEDKVRDTKAASSVPIIRYTSLPVKSQGSADQDNAQSADQGEPHNNQGNNGNSQPDGGNSNENLNNNGNDNAGGGNDNSNNGKEKEKEKEKETKPDKKDITSDKPDKDKKDK